jgi:predicted metal-dependent phosphotriesterase family hydrolase
MTYVQTARGKIDTDELGFTLPHEHIICDSTLCQNFTNRVTEAPWGSYMLLDETDVMAEELRHFATEGGGTVVDVTCQGWGRDPEALRVLSERTGVHIIVCAGFYVEDCMPSWVATKTVEQLSAWLIREFDTGCNTRESNDATNVKAGILKTSVSRPNFSHNELKGLKAVAKAHLKTGAPITSHNSGNIRYELESGNVGMEMLDRLEAEGVDPEAVIVGHTDENVDVRNLYKLVKRGAWIQFDTIGKQHYLLDETRADLAVSLNKKGLLGHLLISQDRNRKPFLRKYGGPGYNDIMERFIPLLLEKGLSKEDIHLVTIENPAKALRIRQN